jgi:hypothetical protein
MREVKNACRNLGRKSEAKRPLGRLGSRWKEILKCIFQEIGCENVNGIYLTLYRILQWTSVNAAMDLSVKSDNLLIN